MKSIFDYSLDDLFLSQELEKYNVPINDQSTVASVILAHLNSKPGFIKHKRSATKNTTVENLYLKAIQQTVAKGAPLEIFFTAFNPKIPNPAITNHHTLPDMADLLSLIHLHLVSKGIQSVYDYGFRFIIAYRGNTFQPFYHWSDEDVSDAFHNLCLLRDAAEQITGIRNVVKIINLNDLIKHEGLPFQKAWEAKTKEIESNYLASDPLTMRKVDAWINDFKKTLNPNNYPSTVALEQHVRTYAYSFRALKLIQYNGGPHDLGICNHCPNALIATIRGLEDGMSFQLSPFFRFHSHQRLIALSKTHHWQTFSWEECSSSSTTPKSVYVKEFSYPFYYKK